METRSRKRCTKSVIEQSVVTVEDFSKGLSLPIVIKLCEERLVNKKIKKNKRPKGLINEQTLDQLCKITDELRELNDFIGLDSLKQTLLEHVIYLAQNLTSDQDMNHIQIVGEPGVGKTTLAYLLGRIYTTLGFLENGEVIAVTRADLIGEHLGSTTIKTEEMLQSCIGNVMFIDEVYSFGAHDKRDSFSKECLDCINQFLSVYRQDFLCIIAGYEQDIKECIFSVNKGLERRFPFKYVLQNYNIDELKKIFVSQVKLNEWNLCSDEKVELMLNTIFQPSNITLFESNGGDTEILFMRCKMAHSSRLFFDLKHQCQKKTLNESDLKKGFDKFLDFKHSAMKSKISTMMYI